MNGTFTGEVSPQMHQARRLLLYRSVIAAAILGIATYFYFLPTTPDHVRTLLGLATLFFVLVVAQWYTLETKIDLQLQMGIQFLGDLAIVSGLVATTGGLDSPFAFLFGLVIITAGTQGSVLLVLAITVAASACYLVSIYMQAWYAHGGYAFASQLPILLQTSMFFLAGGVVAAIARRNAQLETTSRRAEWRHQRLRELHEQVMSSMQEGMIVLDDALRIHDCNAAARRLLELPERVEGMPLEEAISAASELRSRLTRASWSGTQTEWAHEGRSVLVNIARIPGGDGEGSWLLTLVDISNMRSLERKLAAQNRLAALGRMTAMLAHELRNPMQAIAQAVEFVTKHGGTESGAEAGEIVREEVGRLDRLVSAMLEYARPLTPEPAEVEVKPWLENAIRRVDLDGRHAVDCVCSCERVVVDPDHFRLVVDNLLRNAVRVSPEPGSVELRIDCPGDGATWRLRVRDSGGGIPADMQDRLFEPFASGPGGGSGLGLATVWQVCEANGWRVRAENVEGGAEFTVEAEEEAARGAHSGR